MADIIKVFPNSLENLQATADTVLEVDIDTTYLGFADNTNPAKSAAKWAVCKVVKSGSTFPITTEIQWSNGSMNKNQVFNDYASLTYQYKNF